jgi:hypothetical protein
MDAPTARAGGSPWVCHLNVVACCSLNQVPEELNRVE